MLRLSAALACAVQGDHAGAAAHSSEAAQIATPLGDRPEAFGVFGPANVGVWRTSLAVEPATPGKPSRTPPRLPQGTWPPATAAPRCSLEKARACAMLAKDADAVRELRHAEHLSPAQARNNPLIRDLVATMLTRARREAGGRDLRGIAWRMNLI